MHGLACKQCIFWSYNTTFNAVAFDENPFTCQCEMEKKKRKKAEGFQLSHFYCEVMAVKGLSYKTTLKQQSDGEN